MLARPFLILFVLGTLFSLSGCQTPEQRRADRVRELGAATVAIQQGKSLPQAEARYRRAVTALLSEVEDHPAPYTEIEAIRRPQVTLPGLARDGIGLPVVARLDPPDDTLGAPKNGWSLPATVILRPEPATGFSSTILDPTRTLTTRLLGPSLPVAMNLEAPIDDTRASGPSFLDGIRNLVRVDRFKDRSRLIFFEPYDPKKTPLVFVHGLMSVPGVWEPVIKNLMAQPAIRDRYQLWFFYYPTGQPIPLSALQLRESLDEAVSLYRVKKKMVLVGYSMGGIVARAQVNGIRAEQSLEVLPRLDQLPPDNIVRRAMIFRPRTDVSKVIFICTPHRGSPMVLTNWASWGMRLIRLPVWLLNEFNETLQSIAPGQNLRLPTGVEGLSPKNRFLKFLDSSRPTVSFHSIIGDRGRGGGTESSDGVVMYSSSHLDGAVSETIVPAGHDAYAHPDAIQALIRILEKP